jgi:DNA-binding LacI/PurR family transcriptional regulator
MEKEDGTGSRQISQKSKMVTARDVAEAASVSVSTVGRALANDPRISNQTKSVVKEAAAKLGYVESLPARLMRGVRSNLVGLMLPDVRNHFYATIAEALSDCCSANGYQLALSLANDSETEARHVKELISARAAGVFIVPSSAPTRETRDLLQNIPHVQLLRKVPSLNSAWFGINDEVCIYQGVRHLIELGHTKIAYVGGTTDNSTGRDRLAGFRRALKEFDINNSETRELLGPPSSASFGAEAIIDLLTGETLPTALITGTVRITQAMLESLHHLKMSTPDDLSVVGFGDAPEFEWWRSGLTTLRMPIQDLATMCGLWFIHQIEAKKSSDKGYQSTVPASLIVRGSTGSPSKRSSY